MNSNKEIQETLEDKKILNKHLLNEVTNIINEKVLPLLLFSTAVETDFTIQGWTDILLVKINENEI